MTEKMVTIHTDCPYCRDRCGCCKTHSHPWREALSVLLGITRFTLGVAALAFAASTGPIAAQLVGVFVGIYLAILCFWPR